MSDLYKKKSELLERLREIEDAERKAGLKSVTASDVGSRDWKGLVLSTIHKLDPTLATDPTLAVWMSTDSMGGGRPKRTLNIRGFVSGDYYAGRAPLPDRKLKHDETRNQAVQACIDDLYATAKSSSNAGAHDQAAQDRAEVIGLKARLAELEKLLTAQAAAKAEPAPAPADSIEEAVAKPIEAPPLEPAPGPDPFAPKAPAKKTGKRGRPRKS